jgi:hypothetical protein
LFIHTHKHDLVLLSHTHFGNFGFFSVKVALVIIPSRDSFFAPNERSGKIRFTIYTFFFLLLLNNDGWIDIIGSCVLSAVVISLWPIPNEPTKKNSSMATMSINGS